mgnify:FL=1
MLIKCCIRCYRKIIYTVAIRITDGREIVMLKLVNLKRKVCHVHFLIGLQEIRVKLGFFFYGAFILAIYPDCKYLGQT